MYLKYDKLYGSRYTSYYAKLYDYPKMGAMPFAKDKNGKQYWALLVKDYQSYSPIIRTPGGTKGYVYGMATLTGTADIAYNDLDKDIYDFVNIKSEPLEEKTYSRDGNTYTVYFGYNPHVKVLERSTIGYYTLGWNNEHGSDYTVNIPYGSETNISGYVRLNTVTSGEHDLDIDKGLVSQFSMNNDMSVNLTVNLSTGVYRLVRPNLDYDETLSPDVTIPGTPRYSPIYLVLEGEFSGDLHSVESFVKIQDNLYTTETVKGITTIYPFGNSNSFSTYVYTPITVSETGCIKLWGAGSSWRALCSADIIFMAQMNGNGYVGSCREDSIIVDDSLSPSLPNPCITVGFVKPLSKVVYSVTSTSDSSDYGVYSHCFLDDITGPVNLVKSIVGIRDINFDWSSLDGRLLSNSIRVINVNNLDSTTLVNNCKNALGITPTIVPVTNVWVTAVPDADAIPMPYVWNNQSIRLATISGTTVPINAPRFTGTTGEITVNIQVYQTFVTARAYSPRLVWCADSVHCTNVSSIYTYTGESTLRGTFNSTSYNMDNQMTKVTLLVNNNNTLNLYYTFCYCKQLQEVIYNNTLVIGEYAFYGCSALRVLPENLVAGSNLSHSFSIVPTQSENYLSEITLNLREDTDLENTFTRRSNLRTINFVGDYVVNIGTNVTTEFQGLSSLETLTGTFRFKGDNIGGLQNTLVSKIRVTSDSNSGAIQKLRDAGITVLVGES